jgi:hypothetical protein
MLTKFFNLRLKVLTNGQHNLVNCNSKRTRLWKESAPHKCGAPFLLGRYF